MREAASDAEVGDDVYGEDPAVNDLQRRAADVLGTETALFVPSGTMGNQVAARVHTERGQELLCEQESHIYKWELAGLAQHAEVQTRTIDGGKRGVIDPEQVREGYVDASGHRPGTGLLALENTHNSKGGTAIAPERIAAAAEAAHDLDVPVHLDGARLFNAARALDRPAAEFVDPVDTVMCCLSKGLGAPVGSLLAGPESTIEAARRTRKLMGGGMRQVGIVAAPGRHALENRHRLDEDHRRATRLADGLGGIAGLSVEPPETNIVLVETDRPAEAFLDDCESEGVLGVPFDDHVVRFCTHWDVDDDDIDRAIAAVERMA
jgi:threonine aldolase